MIKYDDILYDIKVIEHHLKIGYPNHYNLFTISLRKYITEQEKKDELLGLYKKLLKSETPLETVSILKQIKALEEELK